MRIDGIQNIDSILKKYIIDVHGSSHYLSYSVMPIHFVFNEIIENSDYDAAIEDAVHGGFEGIYALDGGKHLTKNEFVREKAFAERIGRRGEELVNNLFKKMKDEGEIFGFIWLSDKYPLSAHDFEVIDTQGVLHYIEVKTTNGEFNRRIHVSYHELLEMIKPTIRYQIYRVEDIFGEQPYYCKIDGLNEFALEMVRLFEQFPAGVKPDSISLAPEVLIPKSTIRIRFPLSK